MRRGEEKRENEAGEERKKRRGESKNRRGYKRKTERKGMNIKGNKRREMRINEEKKLN